MINPEDRNAAQSSSGGISADDVTGELGDLIIGRVPGRTDETQITVCDLTGVGVQDAAIASLVLEKAKAMGLGSPLETQSSCEFTSRKETPTSL